MNKEMREFCHNHAIRIIDTNKRAYKHTKLNSSLFNCPEDFNKIEFDHITVETETLFTLEISQSELERIAKFETNVFNQLKSQGHYNLFEYLMEQKEKEQQLRKKYAGVKKAYEHYSLMLKLASNGELDD